MKTKEFNLCLEKIRSGETEALELIHSAFERLMFYAALRELGNSHDAKDIVSDVFQYILTNVLTIGHIENPAAWLVKAVRNSANHYGDNEHAMLPNATGNGTISVRVDRVTSTLAPNTPLSTETVTLIDERGNLRRISVAGRAHVTNRFNSDDSLSGSVDGVVNSTTSYVYDPLTKRLNSAFRTAGTNVAALNEAHSYNERGENIRHVISGAVSQTYDYTYKK